MSYDTDLTGTITEAYKTAKGKNGLIINCDNPSFKYPVKAYDGTFGQDLDLEKFKVGDKVSFQFDKTDFGNQFKHCRLADGSAPQVSDEPDTTFDYGANRENRPDVERVVSSQPTQKTNTSFNHGKNSEVQDEYLSLVNDAFSKLTDYANLKELSEENKRAVAIGSAIQQMRANGR
tara:strand:+ start:48 stop:575 length:528 start_codon:yes stop_codon:yes gene_type:complete